MRIYKQTKQLNIAIEEDADVDDITEDLVGKSSDEIEAVAS